LIAAILAVAMVTTPAYTDRMTWYAARCPAGVTSLGRTDTCSPYLKKPHGRGGETKWYAAAGWFRWGMPPVAVVVTSKTTGRSVRLIVRDYCDACAKGRAILDISPWGFIALGHELGKGVDNVWIRYEGVR